MASVVERSSRIQGPFEESDFEHQRMSPGNFTDQNRVMFSGDTRVESGTCNVCSAPCSSCMHRRAVAMETSVDCGSSDTTFLRKEGDNCSFNGVNHRSCNELRTAASETSNLLSGSSNDSCCENAESKATLRDSFTCDNSEAVDMLPEVSTVKTIKEETFSEKRISDVGFEMSCTDSRVMQDGAFDEGHRMSTCHKNNDSCTSEATYGNMLDLDLDKRDTPCSSLSTPKCSTKETEMMIQVEKVTHESRVCLTEANMINSTKLNGLLREPFHKKSPGPINVNFSTKSDLSNPSSRKNILSKLTSNSPSLSNHISSENPEDSIDLDATKPSNFQGASHECLVVKDEASARDLLSTDNEVSKSIHIKSGAPSLESKNEEQCAISATDFGRPEYSLHTSETQLQPILDGRASDLDNMLYDVKVCDICGDAGREELLATCSRCVDGAEHTYCMRIMLDKVPEGDWFCEECQLKEKIATRKLNEAEPKFGTSSVPSLNKKIQNLGNFTNIESSRKLVVGSSIPETSASIKEMESPRITSKRHVDQVDDSSTARKKVSEPKYESTKLATPKVDTVFSRVGSSRNLHVAEAKGGSATLSSESRRTNVSRTFSFSLKLDSRGNAFKNLHVAEATRSSKNSSPVGQSTNSWTLSRSPGSLSRQISFRKNFEPKVKKLMEGVPRNLAKDSTSKDKKMLAVARRQLSKSASFNSVSSEHQNIGTIIKAQSFKSRLEDPLVLKPIKERNISFVSDYPDVVQPPNKRMHLPKMDSKTAVPTRDLNNKFESNTLDGGRSENNSGYNEAKKQSSFKCERHGIYDSEDKRAGDLIKNKATQADSGATDTSYKEVGRVTNNASLADCSLQVQSDDKVIVTSSPGASRAPNSVIKPVLVHDKPKETIHSSQSCEIDRLASTAAKPSVVVSLVEGTTKKNKWKDAAIAARLERKRSRTVDQSESMSNNIIYEGPSQSTLTNSSCQKDLPLVGAGASSGKEVVRDSYSDCSKTEGADVQQIKHSMESSYVPAVEGTTKKNKWKDAAKAAMLERKRSRTVDQSESMSNNIIYEGPSQSILTNSSCQKVLPLVRAGASCGKEVVGDSYADYSKTDGADVQQIKHSMESSYVPAVVDLNADPTIIHDSIEKSTIQILSDHPSLFTTTCRALAIPEHEFIWQGAFEILRIGRLPETVDGIQAHLSNVSSPKVHELACQFPCKIQLEEVPRVSLWPLQFQDIGPEENDIALYFFAKDAESYEKSYQKLLEAAVNNDLALKGNINEMELLIFPSSMLPASSQRWNMLFFLWGIFRVRKSDSSIPCASLRERPCGTKTTAEPHDEDVSPSPACELSTFQQPNSQRYPPKEVSRSNESCGASRMKHDSSVDCHAVSSTSPENNIHRVEDLHYKSVAETETTDLSVDSSHSCSKSYSFNQKERCSAEEIYETKLGNKNTEFDLARVPLINTNDEHKLSKSSPGYSIASCFREDEEIKKGRLVKIEAESEVKLTDGVCPSWVSRPNRKRALSCSETISGEVSESTKAIMWQPKESCFVCTEDDRDLKRMNCNSEGPASNNCRVASVERNFPSSTRCPYEQRSDDANYNNVIESTKCPERCFFPVDSHRVGSDAVENFRFFLPPVNEESPDSSIPDLELALGGKKSSSRKQTVSLFSPSVDRGKLGKLSGSIFDDDDMSEALSLSLAFPSVDRKRTDDTEQKDQPTVNTHLFLFGGFTDA